jgi:hypothetical protein
LREHEEVKSNALSCESLNEQLTKCRQRATKLEQDKEHWRLEYQLLQLRHCKVSAKILVCEAIGTVATLGLLCQPQVIVKMIVEKQMKCRLAGETEVLGENLPQRHFCPSQNPI